MSGAVPENDINVTPAMIQAGVEVLDQLHPPLMLETWAAQVYSAMVRAQKGGRHEGEHHITVTFGLGISSYAQGCAMLAFELHLRELTGLPCEVFKATMQDDSKLRRSMTAEQRAKL